MWFRVTGFSSDNTGAPARQSAISGAWPDVDYSQTMPQLGAKWTSIFNPTLIKRSDFRHEPLDRDPEAFRCRVQSYQAPKYGINIPQTYPKETLGVFASMSFGGVTPARRRSARRRFRWWRIPDQVHRSR